MSSDDEEGSDDEQITAGTLNKQVKKSKAKTNVADQKSEDFLPVIFPTEPPAEQVRICPQPPPTVEPLKGNDNGITLLNGKPSVAVQEAGNEAPVTISEEIVTDVGEMQMSSDDEEGSDDEQITAGIPKQQVKVAKAPAIAIGNTENSSHDKIHEEPPPTVETLKAPDKGNNNAGDDGATLPHGKPSVAVQEAGNEAPVTISEEIVTDVGEMQMSSDDGDGSYIEQITAGTPNKQEKGLDNGGTLPPKPVVPGNEAPVKKPENDDTSEITSGTPPQVPVNKTSPPNGEDDEEDEDEDESDPRQAEEMTVSRFLGYFISNPVLVAFFVLCLTIFAIIILSELFKFIQAVQSAPFLFQMAGVVVGSGLAIAFVWAAARLVMTYRLFVISPQVQLDQIRDPYSRAIIRKKVANKANKQVEEGYQALVTLVREYPIEDPKQIKLLRMAGMTEAEEVKFKKDIADLKESDSAGRSKWIEDCDSLFVKKIDDFASQRVSDYSKRVGIKTALCPTGFLDALIVIVNSFLLVEELCRLYNVRANWRNSAFLAARLVFNTFISAKLEKSLDNTANFFSDELALASTSLGNAFSKLFLGVGKRMVEGAFNYFLIKRLGHATMRYLRPIKLK